jgi:hypothetical protein
MIFYGFPVVVIASVLGVSRKTARRYKAGHRVPRPALRLWALHVERRVLPDGWVYNDRTLELVAPNTEAVPLRLVAIYPLVIQLAREYAPENMRDWLGRSVG